MKVIKERLMILLGNVQGHSYRQIARARACPDGAIEPDCAVPGNGPMPPSALAGVCAHVKGEIAISAPKAHI